MDDDKALDILEPAPVQLELLPGFMQVSAVNKFTGSADNHFAVRGSSVTHLEPYTGPFSVCDRNTGQPIQGKSVPIVDGCLIKLDGNTHTTYIVNESYSELVVKVREAMESEAQFWGYRNNDNRGDARDHREGRETQR